MGTERRELPGKAAKCWQRFRLHASKKILKPICSEMLQEALETKQSGQLVITLLSALQGQQGKYCLQPPLAYSSRCLFLVWTIFIWDVDFVDCVIYTVHATGTISQLRRLQSLFLYVRVCVTWWSFFLLPAFTSPRCLSLLAEGQKWAGEKEKGMAQKKHSSQPQPV